MKKYNTGSPPRLAVLLAGAALLGLVSQNALAAGTTAATTISNQPTLSYSVGGVPQTDITPAATTFLVDEKINLTVAGTGAAISVVPGATSQVATFTVTNNANSPLDFNLAANQPVGGSYLALTDNFDATGCIVRVESGATGGYQAGEDTATFIDELAADASKTVYVVCSIPAGQINGDAAIVGLTATARGDFTGASNAYAATVGSAGAAITATAGANTANVDIVFADIAGSEAGDAANDAKHSARDVFSVVTSALSVTKTVTVVCDPYNGVTNPKNIPGAIVKWSIAVANTGASAATLTTVVDTLAATLAHDANLVVPTNAATCSSGAGTPESAANKGFKVTANANRAIGTCANTQAFCYFTTNTADGLDIAGQVITATFATILPTDAGTGHASAGLLNAGETVTVIFNTTVQ